MRVESSTFLLGLPTFRVACKLLHGLRGCDTGMDHGWIRLFSTSRYARSTVPTASTWPLPMSFAKG
jgi:hypothetical protein